MCIAAINQKVEGIQQKYPFYLFITELITRILRKVWVYISF